MRAVPIVLFVVGAVVVFRFLTRSRGPNDTRIGPQGRWWWLKLLVAFTVTAVVLYVVIWGYVSYSNNSG